MTLRDRIYLTWCYGKTQLVIGLVYNLVCASWLSMGISYSFFVDAFIIKTIIYAITLFLIYQFRNRDAIFFYINLGLSRRKMELSVLLLDFLSLAVLMTAVLIIYG